MAEEITGVGPTLHVCYDLFSEVREEETTDALGCWKAWPMPEPRPQPMPWPKLWPWPWPREFKTA